MHGKVQIVRGEGWAARLQGHLTGNPGDMTVWMERNTHALRSAGPHHAGLLRLGGGLCFLKFYPESSFVQRLLDKVRTPKAARSYDTSLSMRSRGIAVPKARGCLRVPGGMLLMSQGIESARNFDDLWRTHLNDEMGAHLMHSAGQAMADMHSGDYIHGDCKWGNLVWGRQRVYFVDLDDAQKVPPDSDLPDIDVARFTVDAELLGVDAWFFDQFLDSYVGELEIDADTLCLRVQPHLAMLRQEFAHQYTPAMKYLL